MTGVNKEEITILVVEDNDGHAELIMEQLRETGVVNPMIRFRDGQEIWDFLSKKSKVCRDSNKQYLMLLDIRMPRMDGVEVLRKVKSDDELKKIPVVMLTTTDDPLEIDGCYKLGCNFYITKPVDFLRFAELLKRLGLFIQVIRITDIK